MLCPYRKGGACNIIEWAVLRSAEMYGYSNRAIISPHMAVFAMSLRPIIKVKR